MSVGCKEGEGGGFYLANIYGKELSYNPQSVYPGLVGEGVGKLGVKFSIYSNFFGGGIGSGGRSYATVRANYLIYKIKLQIRSF